MRYRKLDENGDYTFGHSQADFYINQPEAVGQAVLTRLYLFLGEWFLDTRDGTAWKTQVLGRYTASTRDAVIQSRTIGTQGVNKILKYASQFDPNKRNFGVQIAIDTIYGPLAIVAGPTTPRGSPPGWAPPYGEGPGTGGPR